MAVSEDKVRKTISLHKDLADLVTADAEAERVTFSVKLAGILAQHYAESGRYEVLPEEEEQPE